MPPSVPLHSHPLPVRTNGKRGSSPILLPFLAVESSQCVCAQDILDLLDKCFPVDAIECFPPAMEPPPPSGLMPSVPSFECIEQDVMYINGCVYRIGASPEGPVHAVEYVTPDRVRRYGVLLRRTEQLEVCAATVSQLNGAPVSRAVRALC